MPTEQEQKESDDKVAAEKADSDAAEAVLKEVDELAEKGEAIKEDGFVKVKKSQLHQLASDKNNYKKATLSKKAEERQLDNKGGDGGKSVEVKADVIDQKKVEETATTTVTKTLRAAAEKTAKRQFFKDHPEYVDDKNWNDLLPNLSFKGDEVTHEEVLDRMEAAVLEHKRKTGKLDEYMEDQKKRARSQGFMEGRVDQGREFGGAGDRNGEGKEQGQLSEKGKEMARSMHVDPEKVKKVDVSKDSVIDIFNKEKKK